MTLTEIMDNAGVEVYWDDLIDEIKKHLISLLEPYIGPDFRTAERVIRDAE